MTARNIPGWNHDIDPWAEWIAPRIPRGGTYLEVGVFLGASLAKMGELRPDISLIAVDPWVEAPGPGWVGAKESIFADVITAHGSLFLAFVDQMRTHAPDVLRRTRVIQGTARTVKLLDQVDMLFIDGAHDEMSVRDDLWNFAPLVRKGGIVSGHDYTLDFLGVVSAVNRYYGREPELGTPDGKGPTCWHWTT
jgi:hypothetical protein